MVRLEVDNCWLLLTVSTFKHVPWLDSSARKEIVLRKILETRKVFQVEISAYSIAPDHYHLVALIVDGRIRSKIIQYINGGSSYLLNQAATRRNKIWSGYWDRLVIGEKAYYHAIGYVHGNPLKHGLVKTFAELEQYRFGSYREFVKNEPREFAEFIVEYALKSNRFGNI